MVKVANPNVEKIIGKWESIDDKKDPNDNVYDKYKLIVTKEKFALFDISDICHTPYNSIYNGSPSSLTCEIVNSNLIIKYHSKQIEFKKVKFEDEYKFYRNKDDDTEFVALRFDGLWEYCKVFYFTRPFNDDDIEITEIKTGKDYKSRMKIACLQFLDPKYDRSLKWILIEDAPKILNSRWEDIKQAISEK